MTNPDIREVNSVVTPEPDTTPMVQDNIVSPKSETLSVVGEVDGPLQPPEPELKTGYTMNH